jgi:succinate-semialdehyde dehydrogenase / glutarate-semialdehyde dehydrogenase
MNRARPLVSLAFARRRSHFDPAPDHTGDRETMTDTHLLIAGEILSGNGRDTAPVLDPATGETIGQVTQATAGDLDRALDAAAQGFKAWRDTGADQRSAILMKAAALIRERANDIGVSITREQGKPLKEAIGETIYCAMLLEFYAGEVKRIYGRTLVRPAGSRVEVQYHPVGPVAGFAAWNFPALNVMRKIGGALAAGCSTIVKPSEETPSAGLAIVQAFVDAGVPGDAAQCVFGVPDEVSRHLLGSPVIRKVTFTGSTAVGKHLAKLAAEDLKIATMELGGHAPVLVFADSDVDKALDTMAANKYRNAGQVCVSPTRFLVEEPVFEKFRDGFVERAKAVTVGNGMDKDTQMGPMASARGLERMESLIGDAKAQGANLLAGGERIGNQGFFHQPTVLSEVPTGAEIMTEEPFGPVAIINPMAGEDAMIEEANRLPYGLAAYAWTKDPARRRRLAAGVEAGMLAIDTGGVSAADAPFGGIKWSGYGSEDGREGVMACMVPKTVHEG